MAIGGTALSMFVARGTCVESSVVEAMLMAQRQVYEVHDVPSQKHSCDIRPGLRNVAASGESSTV